MLQLLDCDHVAETGEDSQPMTKREQEEAQIKRVVEAALASRPINPAVPASDTFSNFAKICTGVGSFFGLILFWYGGTAFIIDSAITKAMVQPGKDIAGIAEQVKDLRRDVDRLLDKKAENLLKNPPKIATDAVVFELKEAADRAVANKLPIDPEKLKEASLPLLEQVTPAKWEAVQSLLNLRSIATVNPEQAERNIAVSIGPGSPGPRKEWVDYPINKWLEFIGPATLKLDGKVGELKIAYDRPNHPISVYRNVIFRKVHIIYRGGQITLINVFFDDCTFEIQNNPIGLMFAKAIFEKPFTDFSAD